MDKANVIISKNLREEKFSLSGRFTIDELLNLTTSLTLNPDGTITENKLKDFDKIKGINNFSEIRKEGENYILISDNGNSYTISFNGSIKIDRNGQNEKGEFNWNIKDAIEKISNLELLYNSEEIKKFIKNMTVDYQSPDAFKNAFKTFLNNLKNKNNEAYEELINDLEIDNLDNLDDIINKLNSCKI